MNNAYILFYQRKNSLQTLSPDDDLLIPRNIRTEVWKDNETLFRDNYFFSIEFSSFFLSLLKGMIEQKCFSSSFFSLIRKCIGAYSVSVFSNAIPFMFYVAFRLKNNPTSSEWWKTISLLLFHSAEASEWFLSELIASNLEWLKEHLLSSDSEQSRNAFSQLLISALQRLYLSGDSLHKMPVLEASKSVPKRVLLNYQTNNSQ